MIAWWTSLSSLNQAFYALAAFFSVLFLWQFIASLSGLGEHPVDAGAHGGAAHLDTGHAGDIHLHDGVSAHGDMIAHNGHTGAGPVQAHEGATEDSSSLITFKLLSIRSALAFGTLFSWAAALYLQQTIFPLLAFVRAALWGLMGMVIVALFFWVLPRLTEEGTSDLDTAIGRVGQVYLNIPEDGLGQVKVIVSGAVSFVRARSRSGQPLSAGTEVRVVRRLDGSTLEVEPLEV